MSDINDTPRKARLLTGLRINEVSAVDRGAGEGVKIVLMKRDDEPPPDARSKGPLEKWERVQRMARRQREREEFERIWGQTDAPRSFNDFMAKAADTVGDNVPPVVEHHASKVADLLVESGRHPDRAAALHHLLHSARGAALLQRLSKQKDTSAVTDNWQNIARDHGVIAIAKMITDEGVAPGSLDEHEYTSLVTEYAKRQHPGLTPEQAFSRVFSEDSPQGQLLRQAHGLTKSWPAPMSISPTMVGGSDAFPSAQRREGSSPPRQDGTNRGGASSAYDQLVAMAERQRKDGETAAAAFMRVYLDPANASLASAERAQNRPNGGVRIME